MGGALTLPHSHPASRRAPPTSPSSSSSPPPTPATASKMSFSCCKHSTTGEPRARGPHPWKTGLLRDLEEGWRGVEARGSAVQGHPLLLSQLEASLGYIPPWVLNQTSLPIVRRRKLRHTLFMASEALSAVSLPLSL